MKRSNSKGNSPDEFARIRLEIKDLSESLASLRQEVGSLKEAISSLLGTQFGNDAAQLPGIRQHCVVYAQEVSTIDIVRKVLLIESGDIPTIWTIIDDPPPADSPHRVTYASQLHTLRILQSNMPLHLEILSSSKASRRKQLRAPNAQLIWERQ